MPEGSTGGSNVYQVNRGQISNGSGGDTGGNGNGGGVRDNAITVIDSRVGTDPNIGCSALTKVMAHEIGHTFGLGECPSGQCLAAGRTVMGPMACTDSTCTATDYNRTDGAAGPTPCDNGKVKEIGQFSYPPCSPVDAQACQGLWDPVLCRCNGLYDGGGLGGGDLSSGDPGGGGGGYNCQPRYEWQYWQVCVSYGGGTDCDHGWDLAISDYDCAGY
jgi:hypothetical protein